MRISSSCFSLEVLTRFPTSMCRTSGKEAWQQVGDKLGVVKGNQVGQGLSVMSSEAHDIGTGRSRGQCGTPGDFHVSEGTECMGLGTSLVLGFFSKVFRWCFPGLEPLRAG